MADGYFRPNSTEELIANNLRDGDVLLFNRPCGSLPLPYAAICAASKYGISGDGRDAWDHAAMVVRDGESGVPYLLEGGPSGVTLRTFEERLLQGSDHQEVRLLPLRGVERDLPAHGSSALRSFVEALRLERSPDGHDGHGTRCQNLWEVYRDLRSPPRTRRAAAPAAPAAPAGEPCRFGAPLVVAALQRLGALDPRADPALVTPASLAAMPLQPPAIFGRPVPLRSMDMSSSAAR